MAQVDADECILPDDYQVMDFAGTSVDGGSLESFDFTFFDDSTLIKTTCHLNDSSIPIEYPDRPTKRWPCDDELVQFIWQEDKLILIERVCPDDDGCVSRACSRP